MNFVIIIVVELFFGINLEFFVRIDYIGVRVVAFYFIVVINVFYCIFEVLF